jgi:hypothetical protein
MSAASGSKNIRSTVHPHPSIHQDVRGHLRVTCARKDTPKRPLLIQKAQKVSATGDSDMVRIYHVLLQGAKRKHSREIVACKRAELHMIIGCM